MYSQDNVGRNTIAMVLAGGKGERLSPLTLRRAKIRRAIIDKGVVIPDGSIIGYDLEEDRRNGYTVTESGIVVVPRKDKYSNHCRPAIDSTGVMTGLHLPDVVNSKKPMLHLVADKENNPAPQLQAGWSLSREMMRIYPPPYQMPEGDIRIQA